MFGFDQKIGGVVNQSPSLESGSGDSLSSGVFGLKGKHLLVVGVIILLVYMFVIKKG